MPAHRYECSWRVEYLNSIFRWLWNTIFWYYTEQVTVQYGIWNLINEVFILSTLKSMNLTCMTGHLENIGSMRYTNQMLHILFMISKITIFSKTLYWINEVRHKRLCIVWYSGKGETIGTKIRSGLGIKERIDYKGIPGDFLDCWKYFIF